jgi:protein-S-isoprenylcysteine O-methyltransferase Ste14
MVFALVRSLAYGSVFVAVLLVVLPARLLEWSGVVRPSAVGFAQLAGAAAVVAGAALAAWCVATFARVGRGTPAPFDPPRRLVVAGPYRWMRNPMYAGAVVALLGAALFYGSWLLAAYAVLFLGVSHGFVRLYEEPTLQRLFGGAYEEYRREVDRWLPMRSAKERV